MLVPMFLAALSTPAAFAADPLLDLGVRGYAGPAGGVKLEMGPDLAGRGGVALVAWPARQVGLGLRVDTGSYGIVDSDAGNTFAFAEAQVRLAEGWEAGLGVGTPVVFYDYFCAEAPCEEGLWARHYPIAALQAVRSFEHGLLHVPVALRGEVSAARWSVGLDVGLGLRAHRKERSG